MTFEYDRKRKYQESQRKAEQRLIEGALKAIGLSSFKFNNGLTQPSDEQKIKALEAHVEQLKLHRYQMQQEHGDRDASSAISHLNSEISRALQLVARLKSGATRPEGL